MCLLQLAHRNCCLCKCVGLRRGCKQQLRLRWSSRPPAQARCVPAAPVPCAGLFTERVCTIALLQIKDIEGKCCVAAWPSSCMRIAYALHVCGRWTACRLSCPPATCRLMTPPLLLLPPAVQLRWPGRRYGGCGRKRR